MFQQFVQEVNSQDKYNHDGTINTIPIITYHNFTNITNMNYVRNESQLTQIYFLEKMKFLYDNHFIVLPISDIRYNENTEYCMSIVQMVDNLRLMTSVTIVDL